MSSNITDVLEDYNEKRDPSEKKIIKHFNDKLEKVYNYPEDCLIKSSKVRIKENDSQK